MLFSHVTSALYLLEHAIWAHATGEPTAETDIEVFRRWAQEGGLDQAIQEVQRAKADNASRPKADAQIVYGAGAEEESLKARLVEKGRLTAHL